MRPPPAKAASAAVPASAPQAELARAATADGGAHPGQVLRTLMAMNAAPAFGEALQKNAAAADQHADDFCAESKKLQDRPPMSPLPQGGRDAADFMAPLIDYESPLDEPKGRLHLPDSLVERLAGGATFGAQPDWGTRITAADLAALDFSWLTALGQFDRWGALAAGRLKDFPTSDFFSAPIPNYASLMQWSKLRFALARHRGDHAAASAEVRHLADLMRTQQILIGDMVAAAIYRLDGGARRGAVGAGADVTGWEAPDDDALDRYRRIGMAAMFFGYPGVRPETVRKAMGCAPVPCTALIEAAGANRAFGAYAADNLQLVLQLAAERSCDQGLLARAVATHEADAADALRILGSDLEERIPKAFAATQR